MIDYDYRLDYITSTMDSMFLWGVTPAQRLEGDLSLEEEEYITKDGFMIGEIKARYTMRFVSDKTGEQVIIEEKGIRQFCNEYKILGVAKTDRYWFHVIPKYVVKLVDMLEFISKSRSDLYRNKRGHLDSFYLNLPYSDFTNYFLGTGFLDCTQINGDLVIVSNGNDFSITTYKIPDIKKFNALMTKYKVLNH